MPRILCARGCCVECDECSAKPGSPEICKLCLELRTLCNSLPSGAENRLPANTRQVGGNHYRKAEGEQHWDRQWRLFGSGYFVGCITKYVERYRDKNGLEDLEKARHFLDKLIELEKAKEDF